MAIIKKLILFFSLFLISHFLFPIFTYALDLEGGEIKAIEVEGLTRLKQEELIDIICFHVGNVIDRDVLRAGIKRAFKKRIFLDIEAVAEPYDGGIKLKYIVKEIPVIKQINIEGNEAISERKIKKLFIFKKGDDFKEDLLDNARVDLQHFYYRKGFPDAKVKISVGEGSALSEVNISLQIEEGQPLIIKKINILSEVKDRIRISEGDVFDIDRVQKDIKRLKKYYKKQKRIKPIVGPYEFKDGELIIPITLGPKLEVVFEGNEVLSSKRLSREVPFLKDEEVTDVLLRETIDKIKRLYQKKGYYYVQVSGGIETEGNLIRVVFFISEGKKVILGKIKFEGINIHLEAIKAIIPLQENDIFDKGLLNSSKESIIGFYNALGYLNADVTDIKEDFLKDGSELNLIFVVYQGPQVRVKKIEIKGNKVVGTHEIKRVLQIEEGAPFNDIDIGDARYRILSLYNRFGYINAEVEIKSVVGEDMASITFEIKENEPYVFGKIIISGNKKTKDKIIRREFVIEEGEPYNYESIFRTRQRLYKLGLFSTISIGPIETSDLKKHTEEKDEVHTQDVLVDVREGNPGAVEAGLGYGDYERARGFLDISYRNLGGYNRQIGLRAELSSVEQRYMLNFREPWLFNKPSLPLRVFLTKEKIRSIDIDTKNVRYKLDRLSLVAGVDKEFTGHLKGSLNYEYSLVKTTDVEPGIILSKEDTGTLGISSISPSLFYDTRDNPFDPTLGSFKGIILKFASRAFLSETEFIKALLQSAWYLQIKKGLIFAFSLRGGIAHGFGDMVELPLIERFFLGGRTTVRGYDHDTLGPKGADDTPTGGNVFALVNGELRISLGRGFGMVTFIDGGNVWEKTGDVEMVLRYTAGLGLRYNTPVGPLRIDYGHKLNRKEEESKGEVHFSFGHAF